MKRVGLLVTLGLLLILPGCAMYGYGPGYGYSYGYGYRPYYYGGFGYPYYGYGVLSTRFTAMAWVATMAPEAYTAGAGAMADGIAVGAVTIGMEGVTVDVALAVAAMAVASVGVGVVELV